MSARVRARQLKAKHTPSDEEQVHNELSEKETAVAERVDAVLKTEPVRRSQY